MGFAKYMEDNIEIFESRMYEKKGINIVNLEGFKKTQKRKRELISLEDEYYLILKEMEKIDIWLNIIENSRDIIRTDFILEIMDKQEKQLNKAKNEYIDYKFDPKFKHLRHKQFNSSQMNLLDYERRIIESYLQCFIDNFKLLDNQTIDDAITINFLYLDIEQLIEVFLNINIVEIQTPLIQYIREDILEDDKITWVLCPYCGEKTYRDYKTCIHCKYPNEVR